MFERIEEGWERRPSTVYSVETIMLILFYLGCDSLFPIDLVHSNPYFHVSVFRPEHCNAVGCIMCVCMKGRESECGCLCVRWLSG